jgi:hypothetical protein
MKTLSEQQVKPSISQIMTLYTHMFSNKFLNHVLSSSQKRFYQRLFTPLILLWCFIFQRLNCDHTLDAVVSHISSGSVDHMDSSKKKVPLSQRIRSQNTAAYSKGRKRLPLQVLKSAFSYSFQAPRQDNEATLWHGRSVALLDGSTLLLTPEDELVEHYGRHRNQHGTTHWVVMRLVVSFCLKTGLTLSLAEGSQYESEQRLACQCFSQTNEKIIYVGDSNFGVFSVAQAARHYQQDLLVRINKTIAKKLSKQSKQKSADIDILWYPSKQDQLHPQMSSEPIKGRLIQQRIERKGFRPIQLALFTTLLEREEYTLEELIDLYGLRWHVELDLRYVKSTMDMNFLTAKSLDMVYKELYATLLAYNLVRTWIFQAAVNAGISPLTLSFSTCLRRIQYFMIHLHLYFTNQRQLETMIQNTMMQLTCCKLPKQERWRIEPRAVRRKPAVYPALKGDREQARQIELEKLMKS